MALELVTGALMEALFTVLFEKLASPEVIGFFKSQKLNDKLLKRLKMKLLSVKGVLEDAEGKQIRNSAVKEWLEEVKDAAFVADDLLDDIYTKAKYGVNEVQHLSLSSLNSIDSGIEKKIEDIIESLESIVEEKEVFCLQERVGNKRSLKTPTTSLVEESNVYGRDNDKEAIIDLLLSVDASDEKLRVIPIVGMAGIGKTTLAQLVYNDERVANEFELKAWVCVSEEFDVVRVTKTILEAIGLGSHDTNDLNSLQGHLKDMLNQKTFLIVLDDVWNENYEEWCHMKSPFEYGAQGSGIIVTTRSQRVVSIMQTVEYHKLGLLSSEDCWDLFSKHAFGYKVSNRNSTLEKIGREIVKKCGGLPLAAKTLGGLLRSTSDCKEWDNILRSDIWDLSERETNILPALLLSYYHLPSHLKRCFAYCSIFPKDYEFEKEDLILLWMAEDLLQKPVKDERIEEVGDKYFLELLSRSFFQQSISTKVRFVMHDLVNDLAQFVSGKFCVRLDDDNSYINFDKRMHHLSFPAKHMLKNFEALNRENQLRTVLTLGCSWSHQKLQDDIFSKLRCLRVLSFSFYSGLENLPESIGLLRHLRYLKVSGTNIRRFPESICSLYNLQTLKATRCYLLAELPQKMHNLVNLRYLHIENTQIKVMPPHMSKLKSLRQLSHFIVGKDNNCSVGQLEQLLNLRGSLSIKNLKDVVDPKEASQAKLNDKKHIEQLYLNWGNDADTDDSRHEKYILQYLQPHTENLKKLSISNYTGTEFPNWLEDHSFCNLVSMCLESCKYCFVLPSLGQLPSLKQLEISNFRTLQIVGREFYGKFSCGVSFPSLEVLKLNHMPAWEKWNHPLDSESCIAFPHLRELVICACPRLTGVLPKTLPFLTKLIIQDCVQIVSSLPSAPAINELAINGCPSLALPVSVDVNQRLQSLELLIIKCCHSLRSFPLDLFPKLKSLQILYCENLESLTVSVKEQRGESTKPFHHLIALHSLYIYGCPNFVSFPNGGLRAPKLSFLSIECCPKLKSLPENMHSYLQSLKEIRVLDCPAIESFPDGGLPTTLRSIEFSDWDQLSNHCRNLNMPCPVSLTHACVDVRLQYMETYPQDGLQAVTLTGLHSHNSSSHRTLNTMGLGRLNSLKLLDIYKCSR